VSDTVVAHSSSRVGKKHVARVAYRCPDGSFVRKRDAWIRAWKTEAPPGDSIVSADVADLDPWTGKAEGEDYVVCSVCGHKSSNLSRHVKREHGLGSYAGPLKSKACERALANAAKRSWDCRGRSEPKDPGQKTHKIQGLTAESLRDLYEAQGLSDAKIGERLGVTGEAIAYQRKKFGVATRNNRLTASIPI